MNKPTLHFVTAVTLISILGIIAYSNSFDCSFHFDDDNTIVNNTAIHDISDLKAIWNINNRRCIGYYSFALNYHYNKLDVFGYHVVNLTIHIITSILVYWLVILILSTPVMRQDSIARNKRSLALICGLLFVCHPLQTQAVTYITQRFASLATMFYIASLCFYVKGRLKGEMRWKSI